LARYKAREEMICQLTDQDKQALLCIYQHRCLDKYLLDRYIYQRKTEGKECATKQAHKLVKMQLVKEVDYGQSYPALFLTTLGVETVKATMGKVLRSLYQFEGGKKSLPLSSDLKMHPKIINHQMHLNAFAMEFESYTTPNNYFRYFDEKLMPPASNFMMPDAMAELSDYYVFLEMDMGTEAGGRLAQKWNSYRTFLNDPSAFYKEKPVVMLFIIDGVKNTELRKRNVTAGLMTHIADRVNGQFEVYIDGVESLHNVIKSKLLPRADCIAGKSTEILQNLTQNHGFIVSQPRFLNQIDIKCEYYTRRLNVDKKIRVVKGRPQEFLMDIWLDGRLSILRNVLYYQRALEKIKKIAHRSIPYLMVVPSEKAACAMLKVLHVAQPQGIYFTTPERMAGEPWPKAVFCIDQLWNLNHFTDESLTETVHERRLFRF